jgi:hypothetical protein
LTIIFINFLINLYLSFIFVENKKNKKEHCLQETLRLHPPVPNDPKVCVSDDTLPSGYQIKKGYIVVWSGWCMVNLKNKFKKYKI